MDTDITTNLVEDTSSLLYPKFLPAISNEPLFVFLAIIHTIFDKIIIIVGIKYATPIQNIINDINSDMENEDGG